MTGKSKVAVGGGSLGLSAAAVIWMTATFATQKQVDRLETKLDALTEKIAAIHTQVVVLDALRANEQFADRKRYE